MGDQSSGKSSVLENLTGFSFPRAAGLCTRYVTQITCSRDSEKSVVISIIPRHDATAAVKTKLRQFYRRLENITNAKLAEIFQEVCAASPREPPKLPSVAVQPRLINMSPCRQMKLWAFA